MLESLHKTSAVAEARRYFLPIANFVTTTELLMTVQQNKHNTAVEILGIRNMEFHDTIILKNIKQNVEKYKNLHNSNHSLMQ